MNTGNWAGDAAPIHANEADYVHQPFPKTVYHAAEDPQTVHSQEELDALGAAWFESPEDAKAAADAAAAKAE